MPTNCFAPVPRIELAPPPLNIPLLDGNVANREGFNTAFCSTVDDSSLQPVIKMMQVKANLTGVAAAAIDGLHLDQGWPNFFNHGPFSEIWTKVRATPHNSIFLFFFLHFH